VDQGPLSRRIVAAFDTLPGQLQTAARFVLKHPRDVALLSMREQARRAGVPAATMTRLAKQLGYRGYDALRERYADAVRDGELGFAGRASAQVATQKQRGDRALAIELVESARRQLAALAQPATIDRLVAAATLLTRAQRVYCLGLRSSHSIAWQFHYVLSLLEGRTVLLDAPAGTGTDPIRGATRRDALLVVSVLPYTRATIETARYAAERGVPIVAITDSEVAPLARMAQQAIVVDIDSPSFFHTMTPAFVVAEALAALVAGRGGDRSRAALLRTEEQLAAFDTHLRPHKEKA
jgi:DNA-binding MurR/RpiR family transcriptional regulator